MQPAVRELLLVEEHERARHLMDDSHHSSTPRDGEACHITGRQRCHTSRQQQPDVGPWFERSTSAEFVADDSVLE
jgi:hypothetical protein